MDQLFPVRFLSTRADERGGFVAVVIAVLTAFGSEAKVPASAPTKLYRA